MAKFHINGNGEAGACKAEKGGCPFGGENEHFTSAEAARSAYEEQMNVEDANHLRRILPNLDEVHSEAPRLNIGYAKATSDLKGLQRDIDSGYVTPSEIPSHIARIADKIERQSLFEDQREPGSSGALERAAYLKKLRKLSRGAEASKLLQEQPHWKEVLSAVFEAEVAKAIASDKKYSFTLLRDRLNGEGPGYDGYSDQSVLLKAKEIRDSLTRVRNPKLLNIANKIDAALKADGRLS